VVLGRDQYVRVLATGVLYPFGHRAQLLTITQRTFHRVEQPPISVAALIPTTTLFITEPVRRAVEEPALAREFPFNRVEILGRSFAVDSSDAGLAFFLPRRSDGEALRFPIRCSGTNGDVLFDVPLVFTRSFPAGLEENIARAWEPHSKIPLPGAQIDMVRGAQRRDGDTHEVHQLSIAGVRHGESFRPSLIEFQAELPALRAVLGESTVRAALKFSQAFLDSGPDVDLALIPAAPIPVDFTKRSDRSGGLMAPKFVADAISRRLGPVAKDAMRGTAVALSNVYSGATLLGMPLAEVVDLGAQPAPSIVPVPGNPPGATMTWTLPLREKGPFMPKGQSSAVTLTVERLPARTEIGCTIVDFSFALPPGDAKLLMLSFGSLVFKQEPGKTPKLELNGLKFEFFGALQLLKTLVDRLQPLLGSNAPVLTATPSGVSARYSLGLDQLSSGAFVLRNVGVHFGVDVPFNDSPSVTVGFGRRDAPFNLSVLALGGGGYIALEFGKTGLARLEASLEFGATVAINFIVATAEVHALGGIRFLTHEGSIGLDAFIRLGGSIEVLGLVSVSVELRVTLTYDPPHAPPDHPGNRLIGQAVLVIEVDLTFISESVKLDSGLWELTGPRIRQAGLRRPLGPRDLEPVLDGFLAYHEAFAS
jgi:hypothetical protein